MGKRNKSGSTEGQEIEPQPKRLCNEINKIEKYKIGKKLQYNENNAVYTMQHREDSDQEIVVKWFKNRE